MSSKEYVFRVPRKAKETTPLDGSVSPKQTILEQYDHYQELMRSNETLQQINVRLEVLSREITSSFGLLQKETEKASIQQLSEKLQRLTTLSKQLETDREELLQRELSVLYHQWPTIYGLVTQGTDRETLNHVLTTYEQMQSGHISADQAVHQGMDFMTTRYHLPENYFNRSAVSEFNKNLSKLT